MAFPDYWYAETLRSMNWPRKEGGFLRKKWVVHSLLADMTLDGLIDTGIQIGADSPEIGLKLLASQFDTSGWHDDQGLREITTFLDKAALEVEPRGKTDLFQRIAPVVPWEAFGQPSVVQEITTRFVSALWLSLTKPQSVSDRIDSVGKSEHIDVLVNAGLQFTVRSREEYLQCHLDTVRSYEQEREKLSESPSKMVDYIGQTRSN